MKRKQNPETIITHQVREFFKLMRIPHFKHFGGPLAPKGIPDIIGTLPSETLDANNVDSDNPHIGGRALYIELKAPGGRLRPEQREFLETHAAAGALAFWADNAVDVVRRLAKEGYAPAVELASRLITGGK